MNKEQVRDIYSNMIALRTYCRFDETLGRRETWTEAVNRYAEFLKPRVPNTLMDLYNEAIEAVHNKEVMPSMRLLWTAGKAAELDNICQYNCSYTPINTIDVFAEIMYLLMNGVGVGVSVERQYIVELPVVSNMFTATDKVVVVEDSKEGWSLAYKELIQDWYNGIETKWDTSKVRPKGTPIKTFGGKASGGEVLVDLFTFTFNKIKGAKGRKLESIELADIACKTAEIVICGGTRRSAIIIFSNLSDLRMREYKKGQFWLTHAHRSLANISTAYTEEPNTLVFLEEMKSLIESQAGERGIVNVQNFVDKDIRYNPCQPKDALVYEQTKGLITFGELNVNDYIWSKEGWTRVLNKWSTGIKEVYEYKTNSSRFLGTKNHKVLQNGEKIEVQYATHIDCSSSPENTVIDTTEEILETNFISKQEVFDITVDNESHTYWTEGCNVSNCGERGLRPNQLCNLTEVVVSKGITKAQLHKRVQLATLLGTIQASLTDFNKNVLRPRWKEITEEEALLGVSLTGIANKKWNPTELIELRTQTKYDNKYFAKELGINEAKGITCCKPSGTVSQLVGCSSGIHSDYAKYYIRRIRVAKIDPICKLLVDQGVPFSPEVGQNLDNATSYVFEFPIEGKALVVRENETALAQLERWKLFKLYWCDDRGNPSCTVYVKEEEWIPVINWVKTNWDIVGGLSFLPYDNGVYQLAPYEEITKEVFDNKVKTFPEVDFTKLSNYEQTDNTTGAKEYSCLAGNCELT